MKQRYSPTWISDTFPLKDLECQYFDICRSFNPKLCKYKQPCRAYFIMSDDTKVEARAMFRHGLETYVTQNNLSTQIKLILGTRRIKP